MLRNGPGIAVGVMALALSLGSDRARAADDKTDAKVKQLQAELDQAKKEADALRKKNEELADLVVKLALAAEAAKKDVFAAQNAEKLARAQAEDNLKRLEEERRKSPDLKNTVPLGVAPVLKPPVLANLRGEVTAVADDQVMLSIGIDAGLAVGTTLDVYRLDEKTPRYLGTVKVTSALNLFPKQAVVTFTPARKVALDKLRPEELPKKGDEVRPLNALLRDR